MSDPAFDDDHLYYLEDDMPEGCCICDRCDGRGNVQCYCAGDFCLCGAEDDLTCPVCGGDTWITQERYEKRAKIHREIMKAIWGDKAP